MPGFCIFYTERNKQKNFDYEKATLVFMAVCLAVMPVLHSCDDDEGYSIGDFTRRCGLRCVLPAMLFIWTVMCGERSGL